MVQSTVNIGTLANDGTGDDLREAFIKVNNNFNELYLRTPESTTASNKLPDDATTAGVFADKTNDNLNFNEYFYNFYEGVFFRKINVIVLFLLDFNLCTFFINAGKKCEFSKS